jgi:hypothetical protein
MAFRLIQADQNIINSVKLTLEDPEPVDGWPLGSGDIPIQFPPRVKTKSKAGNWHIKADTGSWEPIAVWKGAMGTKITIELKYVVTGGGPAGGPWDVDRVSKIIHNIMGYFYRPVAIKGKKVKVPVLKATLYEISPEASEICTWRIEDASVAYSDELILDNGKTYPQVSTVTLQCMMITKIKGKKEKTGKNQVEAPDQPKKEWY